MVVGFLLSLMRNSFEKQLGKNEIDIFSLLQSDVQVNANNLYIGLYLNYVFVARREFSTISY